jgi:hypothetical protein
MVLPGLPSTRTHGVRSETKSFAIGFRYALRHGAGF